MTVFAAKPVLGPGNRLVPGAFAAAATSMGLIAQQVAGKAIREAVFLSTYQTHHLPHAMAAASALALTTVAFMPAVTTRIAPRRLMPILFGANAVGLGLEWLLFAVSHHLGALAIYLHTSVFAPVLITTFWSLINERFDPHTAKAQVARIAAGGTIGGVLGGLAAWRASTLMSITTAILMLAGINLLCMLGVLAVAKESSDVRRDSRASIPPPNSAGRPVTAIRILRDVPFLRSLAILVALGAVLCSLLDYVLGVQAVAAYGKGQSLFEFFSFFGLAVAALSLVFQFALGRIAVEKIGLAVHIAVLPGVVILGSAFGLAVPGLASVSILRGAEMVHRNTLFRSAYELLYTPISEIQKRATKALIDVGCDRAGTVIGSLLTMVLIYSISPKHSQHVLLGIVVVLALATLPVVRQLHAGYVDALERRLRKEADHRETAKGEEKDQDLDQDLDHDQRDSLIQRVAAIQPRSDDEHGLAREILEHPEETLQIGAELLTTRQQDPQRARQALERLDGKTRMATGYAILLLADNELHLEARTALRRLAPMVTGQLIDALVDPEMDYAVRRRIPPVLAAAPSQRAVDGLFASLSHDVRFEVRYAAGRALMHMMERDRHEHAAVEEEEEREQLRQLVLSEDTVIKLILDEIEHEKQVVAAAATAASATASDDDAVAEDEITAPLDVVMRDRVSRGLEHLFTLLAVLLGSEAVRMCFRALHQDDDSHRGTALEYLETVLPNELRNALWPLLGEIEEVTGVVPSVRSPKVVLDDLKTAMVRKKKKKKKTAKAAAVGGSKQR